MKKAFLIYPHQLFEAIDTLRTCDDIFLIEDPLYFSEFQFHKQKLILHRASMKEYEQYLKSNTLNVTYIEHHTLQISSDIANILQKHSVTDVYLYDVTDDWLHRRIKESLENLKINLTILESPQFITSTQKLQDFFSKKTGPRKYFMNDFYIWQRKRLNILVDRHKPTGGAWSFDKENRHKLPKDIVPPITFSKHTSASVIKAKQYVEQYFPNNFGDTEYFWCPVTHKDAKAHLKQFLHDRFSQFGRYEDAMTGGSPTVFHSTISPLLNNGLLTPTYVIDEVLSYAQKNTIPLPSLEGFIRQIIGWREYMRAMYILEGRNIRTKNYFKAKNKLPESMWLGSTGIDPIDHHIHILKQFAYTHHIPRLMVLGNFMNLCHIKPDQVYTWFMEMHIDAYDWVMVPNVYSMALYADGGLLTTKPYIASSNYIVKMSDFKKGDWCEIFDSLFWNFVGTHFEKLQKEGRLGFIGVQYAKMIDEKKMFHAETAVKFIKKFLQS